ncbi:hypothetical protein MARCHEWKA_00070 [Brevundimonas phage vB_BpoS-Marchewka]|uniref:Uncharacterized protein n=1 Tax=Brevundimonas phage vB_BpoS-Marchewka TaxID=2948604 RepID=A0A9E7SSA4_9CAUD|nr:hypothetical protein MARCHEWKA_00070 [Brevundimonas phage vB_BpoS-Marchewka]UTC29529.1 hypothetical protein BAMBUS_04550 [Brevundimonas phage vB_BpoS-Bambus]
MSEVAERAPYHDYQVVVRGRIVKLQDLDLEDARMALMQAIDVLEVVEGQADRMVSAVGRWRDGRASAAGGLGSLP